MPDRKGETESRGELVAAMPGLIVGVVTAAISDLSAPLRLVVVAVLAVVYWSWPRLAARTRRQVPAEAPAPTAPQPEGGEQPPATGDADRPPLGQGWRRLRTPLAVALVVAVLLNVLAVILVEGSLVVLLFVVAWLLALGIGLRLADLSESLRSVLYQVTAVSVGAALTIGGQPIVHEVTQPSQGMVFWHAGWRIALGHPSLAPGQGAGGGVRLSIPAVFENLGGDTATFASQLVVSSQGKHYTEPGPGQDLPNVPGKAQQAGTIAFTVDPSFSFDDAVLTVGKPDENQAVMPLGGSGRAVGLEPQPVQARGRVAVGEAGYLTVSGGELRADLPNHHGEAARGHRFLMLWFSATSTGLIYSFDYRLKVPDGTARSYSVGCDITSQPWAPSGATAPDNGICFEVDDPPKGDYAFFVGSNEAGALHFTIP
jgi:hypothetical protein